MGHDEWINLEEVEALARARMPKMAYDYYASGSESQQAARDNRECFARYRLLPRILRDVSRVDTSTEFLGRRISMPVLVAPMAMHGLAHPDKEVATARAAAAQGVPMCVSTMANCSIAQIAAEGGHPFALFQLYVIRDRDIVKGWVKEAEALGFKALVVTVDAPRLGRREADERNRFALPEGLELANLAPLARKREQRQQQQQQQQQRQQQQQQRQQHGGPSSSSGAGGGSQGGAALLQARASDYGSGLFQLFASEVDDSLTWEVLPWLRGVTKLPIFVKGVLAPEDALLALRHGAHGVIVSNHGGRQLDYAPSALDALPAVVAALRGAGSQAPILMDGGVRRGTDVIKALALGADAVLLGRPVLYGLALGGQSGVEKVLSTLRRELELSMALCGAARVADLGPGLLLRARAGGELAAVAAPAAGGGGGGWEGPRSRL